MKVYFVIFLLGLLFSSCNNKEIRGKSALNIDSLKREELKATIINDSFEAKWIVGDNYKFWIPTKYQMDIVDSIIVKAIKERSGKYYKYLKADSFIKDYYKQYVCYIDSTRDSIVYMNATCEIPKVPVYDSAFNHAIWKRFDWQHQLMEVEDGGDCYWRIYINLTKRKYIKFFVNGR